MKGLSGNRWPATVRITSTGARIRDAGSGAGGYASSGCMVWRVYRECETGLVTRGTGFQDTCTRPRVSIPVSGVTVRVAPGVRSCADEALLCWPLDGIGGHSWTAGKELQRTTFWRDLCAQIRAPPATLSAWRKSCPAAQAEGHEGTSPVGLLHRL